MPRDPRVSYGVAALIRNNEGQILMIRRKGRHAHGRYSVPGGWVDFKESPEQALQREVFEEVGLHVVRSEFFRYTTTVHFEATPEEVQSLTLYFSITAWHGTPENREPNKCYEIFWRDPEELLMDRTCQENLFPGLAGVLRDGCGYLWA